MRNHVSRTFNHPPPSSAPVGAGIIGIPFAIREAGFAVGIILIILVGFLTG